MRGQGFEVGDVAAFQPFEDDRLRSDDVGTVPAQALEAEGPVLGAPRARGIGGDMGRKAGGQEIEGGLLDADMRLHPADHDLSAAGGLEGGAQDRLAPAGKGALGQHDRLGQLVEQARIGGPEAFRVLLGDDDRDVQLPRGDQQQPGPVDAACRVLDRPGETALHIDDQEQ